MSTPTGAQRAAVASGGGWPPGGERGDRHRHHRARGPHRPLCRGLRGVSPLRWPRARYRRSWLGGLPSFPPCNRARPGRGPHPFPRALSETLAGSHPTTAISRSSSSSCATSRSAPCTGKCCSYSADGVSVSGVVKSCGPVLRQYHATTSATAASSSSLLARAAATVYQWKSYFCICCQTGQCSGRLCSGHPAKSIHNGSRQWEYKSTADSTCGEQQRQQQEPSASPQQQNSPVCSVLFFDGDRRPCNSCRLSACGSKERNGGQSAAAAVP